MTEAPDTRDAGARPANWLVTGGCGFIGAALVARLAAAGCNLRVVDNLSVGSREALPVGPWRAIEPADGTPDWHSHELMVADIRDADAALGATRGADAIVHLAANTGVRPSLEAPRLDCETNVIGTLNYLEGARHNGVRRFVLASSGAPLGRVEPPIDENKVPRPMSPYGASKLAGEGYCSAYFGAFGVETVALRFGNVFGPGSGHKQSVIAKFMHRALNGEPLEIYGDGTQTRDFIYIDDLMDAIVRAGTQPGIGGEVFQIASSRERSVNEVGIAVARLVEQRIGRRVVIRHGEALPFEVARVFADTSKARRMLDFEVRTSFEDGLARTLDDFLASAGQAAKLAGEG